MNRKALALLAVGPDGQVNPEPLVEWNFRFSRRANRWTRISYYSRGSYRRGLPRVVARSTVAQEVGVPEEAIARWQAAFMAAERARDVASAQSRLAVGADGSIDPHPLTMWNLDFFPQSRVWRRTRGQRNEVSRSVVAKKVGVCEDLIKRWEQAAIALWERQHPSFE